MDPYKMSSRQDYHIQQGTLQYEVLMLVKKQGDLGTLAI